MKRLIAIPLSHFCERARWALDYCGVPYVEERHLQIFHLRAVKRAGGDHTVPCLVGDGVALWESAAIVAHADSLAAADRRLYPEGDRAEIADFERELERVVGVEARRIAYHQLLPHPRLLLPVNNAGAPLYQRVLMPWLFPFAVGRIRRYYRISPERVAAGEVALRALFDAVAERLGAREYLFGDAFSAADLTFASLSAPVIWPERYGAAVPAISEFPPDIGEKIRGWRDHPAGRHALRMYELHRSDARPTRSRALA
jgi:glutathione S-transferase